MCPRRRQKFDDYVLFPTSYTTLQAAKYCGCGHIESDIKAWLVDAILDVAACKQPNRRYLHKEQV